MATTQLAKKTTTVKTVIFDQTLDINESMKLRLVVDLTKTRDWAEQYQRSLLVSRGIPPTQKQIDPADARVSEILTKMPWLKNDTKGITSVLEDYYEQQREQAYQDGMILAMIAYPENKFENDPTPYPEEEPVEDVPGLVTLTPPKRELKYPAERRLRQLYNLLEDNAAALPKFNQMLDLAFTEIANWTHELLGKQESSFRSDKSG